MVDKYSPFLKCYLKYTFSFLLIYFYLIFNALSSDLQELFLNLKNAPDLTSAQTIESKIWDKWLSSGSDNESNLQMKKGTFLLAQGELDKALELFEDLSKKEPYWAEPINKIATIQFLKGDYFSSIDYIKLTLSLEPRHFGAISGLTQINIALKKYDKALKNLDYMTNIYPLNSIKKLRPFIIIMLKKSYI